MLFENVLVDVELRAFLVDGKAVDPRGADHEFKFIGTALPGNGVAAEFTQIALKDFHASHTANYYVM